METAMVLLLALLAPFFFSIPGAERWLSRLSAAFGSLASHRGWCIVLVGVLSFAARAALAPVLGIRAPAVHDEFSFLLAGDTFASGRLTNPTHPMWVHFESFHIEHQPSYMSMYPPVQGGFLALGQVVFGHPAAGVWLSAAAFCAALCWMLQGWVAPGWALLGALLAVLRLALFSAWSNSYFGGAPAALGGALVLGALPRLKASLRPADAMLLAAGLLILANSRPYEGAVFALPIVFALVLWAAGRTRPPFPALLRRAIIPAAALLLAGAAFMAYYNWRVFGNALTLPYGINRKTYAVVGVFLWDKPGPVPAYHHPAFRDFYVGYELRHFQIVRTWHGFLESNLRKISATWAFFIGPALTLPLVAAATLLRRRELRFPIAVGLVFSIGVLVNTWFMPHYTAPATALIYLLIIYGIERMRQWRIAGRPVGLVLAAGVPAICLVMAAVRVAAGPMPPGADEPTSWCCSGNGNQERAALLHRLTALPEKQLVLVRYGPDYTDVEWVYNEHNIDGAKVVWARYMDPPAKNNELLNYFHDRRVWLLDAGLTPARLSPYSAAVE
jgi:hypothetical protein